jgi:FkbM family methyltransferase
MFGERWKRRVKRRALELVARAGFDVQKQASGFPPYRFLRRIPLGRDALADVKTIHGGEIQWVFDVGAHVGQSAALFSDMFPAADIHSFEPDPDSYRELKELAGRCYPRVRAVNAAAGDADTEARFFVNKSSQTNSLLKTRAGAGQFLVETDGLDPRRETTVRVLTLDRYCAEHAIERIDFLKLDTQGYELRALDGARSLLERQAVPLIYLEVTFVPLYEHQPSFANVYQYLVDRDYRLVWLYDSSFHTHLFAIGANALFVHERLGTRITPALDRVAGAVQSSRAR